MGNVLAAEPPQPTLAPPPFVPPPATAAPAGTEATQSDDKNPGTYEDLHKKCKDVLPQCFEGGKLLIAKQLSNHFQVSHTMTLSTMQSGASGYRFGATYIGAKLLNPQEPCTVFMGDIDPSGNLNANIIHAFSEKIRSKIVAQYQDNKCVGSQGVLDYKGEEFTGSLALAQPDILNSSGVLVGQYLQKVTSNLCLGAELVYQFGPQVPGQQAAVMSLAARLSGNDWQLSGNVNPLMGNAHASYWHKITDQLQVAAEVETSLSQGESVFSAGYQLEVPQANLTFKAQADTNWSIGATFEKKLQPFPFVFGLSGMASYASFDKPQYRFGISLMVG